MTVSATAPRAARPSRWILRPARGERLVRFSEAAPQIGKTPETLKQWHDAGLLLAVKSPGGQWSTFQSFIDDVLSSARPGRPGVIEDIARDWFARRGIGAEAVA